MHKIPKTKKPRWRPHVHEAAKKCHSDEVDIGAFAFVMKHFWMTNNRPLNENLILKAIRENNITMKENYVKDLIVELIYSGVIQLAFPGKGWQLQTAVIHLIEHYKPKT